MQKMSSTLFKKVVPQNFVMHFCHNAWRFVATVLRCWTFGDLAWTSGGGVEAQGSPIEGDLTDPRVKNPSFPFISFQLKIATSVCFGWSFLLFRSLVVMISALHLRSCHRFASDFFWGVDLCWGTAQPCVISYSSPHRLRDLLCPHFTNCLHDCSCIYGVGFAVQATSKISTSPST